MLTEWIEWIPVWDNACENFDSWRYGFQHVEGYYKDHHADTPAVRQAIINSLPMLDMTYLVGSADRSNCRLHNVTNFASSTAAAPAAAVCNDNELATYCQAMLQGENRLDRALKWKAYLRHFYGREIHRLVFVEGATHDEAQLLGSAAGRCEVFGLGCNR